MNIVPIVLDKKGLYLFSQTILQPQFNSWHIDGNCIVAELDFNMEL